MKPDNKTPAKAAKNGIDAKKPDCKKSKPLYFTRYVGNQVKKNIAVAPKQNCPIYRPQSFLYLKTVII